ncbi:hypothetical protein BDV96DRAFT_566694 [Lophiotrema nucula]|uniref:Uncharacterized protein n=1 Tax=Lophiotrema nucula TaxID=690887 RepID=A0A6A5ZMR6_9PLEO|nr:hypothetical protein BDV96DRAFT_566694 [Lophiotrema nucula]
MSPALLCFLLYSLSWCSLLACSPPLRGRGCIKNAIALNALELIVIASLTYTVSLVVLCLAVAVPAVFMRRRRRRRARCPCCTHRRYRRG